MLLELLHGPVVLKSLNSDGDEIRGDLSSVFDVPTQGLKKVLDELKEENGGPE